MNITGIKRSYGHMALRSLPKKDFAETEPSENRHPGHICHGRAGLSKKQRTDKVSTNPETPVKTGSTLRRSGIVIPDGEEKKEILFFSVPGKSPSTDQEIQTRLSNAFQKDLKKLYAKGPENRAAICHRMTADDLDLLKGFMTNPNLSETTQSKTATLSGTWQVPERVSASRIMGGSAQDEIKTCLEDPTFAAAMIAVLESKRDFEILKTFLGLSQKTGPSTEPKDGMIAVEWLHMQANSLTIDKEDANKSDNLLAGTALANTSMMVIELCARYLCALGYNVTLTTEFKALKGTRLLAYAKQTLVVVDPVTDPESKHPLPIEKEIFPFQIDEALIKDSDPMNVAALVKKHFARPVDPIPLPGLAKRRSQ